MQPLINKIPSKRVQQKAMSSILLLSVLLVLFVIGLIVYLLFYYFYIGRTEQYFDFSLNYSRDDESIISSEFNLNQNQFEFPKKVKFDVLVEFQVPESDWNFQLGNVCLMV